MLKNQETGVSELTALVKKIARYLAVITLILTVGLSFYFFKKTPAKLTYIKPTLTVMDNTSAASVTDKRAEAANIPEAPSAAEGGRNPCRLNVANNAGLKVYLVTRHSGLQDSKYQFGASGHEVRESEVVINKPGENIILVLMAYDPVLWKISKTFSTLVSGVVLAGYHEQMLYGLPKLTPVLRAIYETKSECAYFYDSLNSGGQEHYIMQRIAEITGSAPLEIINSAHNGKFYVGDTESVSKLIEYSDQDFDTFMQTHLKQRQVTIDEVAPKEEGIRQLIREGKIRPAGTSDIERWARAAVKNHNSAQHRMHLGFTYVIVKTMQFPRGMYGAHSKAFILSEHVSMPLGDIAHNAVYMLENGVCEGLTC
ncbi:hypothetical protein [Methylomonas methanica]|uniref:hypothetical protein n=1 Tax=Methylomonas methanica TaxID=421 RepID=UPI00059DDA96|nr:hypothetical protein [Methylomonas methanica]